MMIFQKIIDLIELFRAQYLTMEIIQYFFIVQYIFLCLCQFQKLCEFFFKCNFFLFHSSSFLPSSEPARPFPILLLNTHTCPVTEFAVASHFNTANSCCHHVFLRHFRFQKCLPVNSTTFFPSQPFHTFTATGNHPYKLIFDQTYRPANHDVSCLSFCICSSRSRFENTHPQ